MGLKMECNTRRFVLDDRRELQYRVEVQNRVYKKEIAALDAEIRKLERMLEPGTASTTTSSSTSLLFGQHKVSLLLLYIIVARFVLVFWLRLTLSGKFLIGNFQIVDKTKISNLGRAHDK